MLLQDKIDFDSVKENANNKNKQLEYTSIGLCINKKVNSNKVSKFVKC